MMKGPVVGMVVVVLLVLTMVLGMTMRVESTRLLNVGDRGIAEAESLYSANVDSVVGMEGGGKKGVAFHARRNALPPNSKAGDDAVDPIWDVEAESPPGQRQRDRSLWGMSKRLVPTGPNPLHN
ncbi:uncharacterized protein [Physcomitrium patens]|uniref:Uncharacterized protein n=1 Tax=Physcomitrium patens TaxID=3218 RepID=A0A2K1IXI1_PHYPA|nr:hypothetical protein PHYPA_023805 [Physcomitrium patens]